VVSTATKNLQDQLAAKDAPMVAAHVPGVRVKVLKGRTNYYCHLRAQETGDAGQLSLDDGADVPKSVVSQIRRVQEWAKSTSTGDRDELSFEVSAAAWRSVSVTPQECVGREKCPFGDVCFAYKAKDEAAEADVVVVNTHLYGAHLASGSMLLPPHEYVVFDEAHEVPDILSAALGVTVTVAKARRAAGGLRHLVGVRTEDMTRLDAAIDKFSKTLGVQYERGETTGLGSDLGRGVIEVETALKKIVGAVREIEPTGKAAVLAQSQALGPAVHLLGEYDRVTQAEGNELVWLSRSGVEVELKVSLVNVGALLLKILWGEVTGIMTSATIPATLVSNLGVADNCEELVVQSPFDYPNQAMLYVPTHLPDRKSAAYEEAMIKELAGLIKAAGGRTLALFTNRVEMARVAARVESLVDTPILVQDTLAKAELMKRFREEPTASLFGLSSYWQGVDVPGQSLSLVTIDRLPFSRPDDPLSQARRALAGDRAFDLVDLPRATMLLAQGVGRLIRSKEDRGVVCVMDTRLATMGYGRRMLARLPDMLQIKDQGDVLDFLRGIDDGAE
jgi:ATP-dependent DNA helicase DinG